MIYMYQSFALWYIFKSVLDCASESHIKIVF